jgi:hypothetical protein
LPTPSAPFPLTHSRRRCPVADRHEIATVDLLATEFLDVMERRLFQDLRGGHMKLRDGRGWFLKTLSATLRKAYREGSCEGRKKVSLG